MIKLICGDCIDVLKDIDTSSIDLVLTDPPYGTGRDNICGYFGFYTQKTYEGDWDNKTPDKEYFDEILRVGKKVIIFGGNYFTDKLPIGTKWIVWDKLGNLKNKNPYTDVELAWTNFDGTSSKKYTVIQQGFISEERERFHPTQKPVKLFKMIIEDYTKKGDTVLDPFMGVGTAGIACKMLNRNFIGVEIDKKYYDIAKERIDKVVSVDKWM